MAKPDIWMPLYIADYVRDTARLSTLGHGAYFLLMMDYWINGSPSDDDEQLSAITKLSVKDWKRLRPLIASFFQIVDGRWHHKRIEIELGIAREKTEKRSIAGKAGASGRWSDDGKRNCKRNGKRIANASANASGTQWQNDAPSPSPSQKESGETPSPPVSGLSGHSEPNGSAQNGMDLKAAVFGAGLTWLAAKTRKEPAKLRSLVGKWCAQYGDRQTLDAFLAAQRESPVEPIAWITKRLAASKPGTGSGYIPMHPGAGG